MEFGELRVDASRQFLGAKVPMADGLVIIMD
jgi:hypothetical protein